jgi:hypothetical protein
MVPNPKQWITNLYLYDRRNKRDFINMGIHNLSIISNSNFAPNGFLKNMHQERNVKTYKDYLREVIIRDFNNYGYLAKYLKKEGNENGINVFAVMNKNNHKILVKS